MDLLETFLFDQIADCYDKTRWIPDKLSNLFINTLIKEISLHLRSRILEIGVGTGRVAIPLAKNGFNVFGIDTSLSMLLEAKKKLHESTIKFDYIQANAGDIPFKTKSMDLVIFIHVLHLLRDWKEVLRTLQFYLRKKTIVHASLHLNWYELEPFQLYWKEVESPPRIGAENFNEVKEYLENNEGYRRRRIEHEISGGKTTWQECFNLIKTRKFSRQVRLAKDLHKTALATISTQVDKCKNEKLDLLARCTIDIFEKA